MLSAACLISCFSCDLCAFMLLPFLIISLSAACMLNLHHRLVRPSHICCPLQTSSVQRRLIVVIVSTAVPSCRVTQLEHSARKESKWGRSRLGAHARITIISNDETLVSRPQFTPQRSVFADCAEPELMPSQTRNACAVVCWSHGD